MFRRFSTIVISLQMLALAVLSLNVSGQSNLPDMQLDAIQITEDLTDQDIGRLDVRFQNAGSASAHSFQILVELNGQHLFTWTAPFPLEPAATSGTGWMLPHLSSGTYNLRVTIDPDNQILEENETNNGGQKEFFVRGAPGAPRIVAGNPMGGHVVLTWEPSSNSGGEPSQQFRLYGARDNNSSELLYSGSSREYSYFASTGRHSFFVIAANRFGNSLPSNVEVLEIVAEFTSSPPAAPPPLSLPQSSEESEKGISGPHLLVLFVPFLAAVLARCRRT